jgi:hypothetical protein
VGEISVPDPMLTPYAYTQGMRIPDDVRAQFRRHGRRGGLVRARRLPAAARAAIARKSAIRRWIRVRFGHSSFVAMGLPGGDLIDQGLDDLAADRETRASLLVSLASSRLRREGVPLPKRCFSDGDRRLYRLLGTTEGPLAHARYLALIRQVVSFADACRFMHEQRGRHA